MLEKPPTPPRECMEAAKWMLIEAAQKDLPLRKMESLMAEKRTRKFVLGVERTLLVVGGRSKKYMKVAYDQEYFQKPHPLSNQIKSNQIRLLRTMTGFKRMNI